MSSGATLTFGGRFASCRLDKTQRTRCCSQDKRGVWWNKTQEVKAEGITKPNPAWMVQGREEVEELVACQVANEKESQGGRRRRGDMGDIPKPKDPNMVNSR